jgi:hypothetical protein
VNDPNATLNPVYCSHVGAVSEFGSICVTKPEILSHRALIRYDGIIRFGCATSRTLLTNEAARVWQPKPDLRVVRPFHETLHENGEVGLCMQAANLNRRCLA